MPNGESLTDSDIWGKTKITTGKYKALCITRAFTRIYQYMQEHEYLNHRIKELNEQWAQTIKKSGKS